ncbi:MAG: zinc ribbon domain-containing protein [Candidatus Nanoarchaeia archaeon]
MPTKTYRCGNCGFFRDYLIPQEEVPSHCPECDSKNYSPDFSAPNIGSSRDEEGDKHHKYLGERELKLPFKLGGDRNVTLGFKREIRQDLPSGLQLVVKEGELIGKGNKVIGISVEK